MMQHIPKRRPNMDVFRDVEEARPEDLRSAQVISNFHVPENPPVVGKTKKPKKKRHTLTMDSRAKESAESDSVSTDEGNTLIQDSQCQQPQAPSASPASFQKRKRATRINTVSTTVTPGIHALVSQFMDTDFNVVGEFPSFINEEMLSRDQPPIKMSPSDANYKAGDFVIVNEGDFHDETTQRFAQILFFDHRRKNFHARWFIHGSKTILGELALGQELFLSIADNCRDISMTSLVSKCEVVKISLTSFARQAWPAKDSYFYSCAWDSRQPAGFTEVTDDQVHVPSSRICPSCEIDTPISYFKSNIRSIIRSVEYHSLDFIRFEATTPGQLTCSIGQIISFLDSEDGVKVVVQSLGRERDRKGPGYFAEPALFLTSQKETVDAISVLGTCQVLHISEYELKDPTWLDANADCFYVISQAESLNSPLTPLPLTRFKKCKLCRLQEQETYKLRLQCKAARKLRAFDPFAGVGGFGLGLAHGCSMHTSVGIDIDINAAETMRRNFPPNTIVLAADANQILHDLFKGDVPSLVPGKIDLIYSGPPCQNDSTLNRHKNDEKRPVFTLLSFVDILRPAIFIMEAVPGFLQRKIVHGISTEIRAGDLKLVLKLLHFLGYNVKAQLMNSRSFGVPQARDRFIIVATLPDWDLFEFPEVSHAFKKEKQTKPRGYRLRPDLKLEVSVAPGRALHEVVTVAEALSDLPFFDWKSPKKLTSEQQKEANARSKVFPTVSCLPGGVWGIQDEDFEYETPSANRYQQLARRDLLLCAEKRYQHFTKHFPPQQVENVCDVPFVQGADYRHLDQKNRDWCLRDPASAKAIAGYQAGAYTRLDPDGYFPTIVTNVGPIAKQSSVLHPFCKRILTVRELARAQGFPDDFVFYSERDSIDDYHKQIGNSIPFGISAALGRSIQDLVFKKWRKDTGTHCRDNNRI